MNSLSIVYVDRDVPLGMRDGVQLMANVYRPMASSFALVLLSVTPYDKDATPDRSILMRALQRRVFDHFLKGEPTDWERTPRVRLTVRRSRHVWDVRAETRWPIAGVTYRSFAI